MSSHYPRAINYCEIQREHLHAPIVAAISRSLGYESYVEEGGIGVDKLEYKYLGNHAVFVLGFSPLIFSIGKIFGENIVNIVKYCDLKGID